MLLGNWDGGMFPASPADKRPLCTTGMAAAPEHPSSPDRPGLSGLQAPGGDMASGGEHPLARHWDAPAWGARAKAAPPHSPFPPSRWQQHPKHIPAIPRDGRGARWAQAGKPDPAAA